MKRHDRSVELSTALAEPNATKTRRAERARYPESKPAEKK
jgi:hypothetical protein